MGFGRHDVYVSVVGGVRIGDPGADLAVCMALASAVSGWPAGDDVVVLGEVGLGGEVRQVAHTPRRLSEAARLGFSQAIVPDRAPEDGSVSLHRVQTVAQTLDLYLGAALSWLRGSVDAPAGRD
jgi:DNA repair protein RadA/Sms